MASLRKFPGSQYWFACFTTVDGRRLQRSTKETVRKEAQKKADAWESLFRARITAKQANKVIAETFQKIYGEQLPGSTVRSFFEDWLQRREGEVAKATMEAYRGTSRKFLTWLGARADKLMVELDTRTVTAFRNDEAKRVSATTANHLIRILRVILEDARREGLIHENPAKDVSRLKPDSSSSRRPLTVDEIKTVLAVANEEWRSMVLFGLYTGQRLSDIAGLTWNHVDLAAGEVSLRTRKTDRMVRIPICSPLAAHIESLPSSDDPGAPLHPRASALISKGQSSRLSREFGQLLAVAGLADESRLNHQGKGIGRAARRAKSEISFHSLRHTATSLMKNAGISPAVVQDIIGHDSAEMSTHYTKIERDAKAKALDTLPDLRITEGSTAPR